MSVNTTIPPELLRSTPRSVALSGEGKAFAGVGFVFALIGLVGAPLFYVQSQQDEEKAAVRQASALTAEGRIKSIEPYKREKKRLRMGYQFAADGVRHEGSFVSRDRLEPGSPVTVEYMPHDPSNNWVAGHPPNSVPAFIAPLFGLVQLGAAGLIFWKLQRQKELLRQGRATIATASKVKEVRSQYGRNYTIDFAFNPSGGGTRNGRTTIRKPIGPVGTDFVVIYLPDQPKRVESYPVTWVKISN